MMNNEVLSTHRTVTHPRQKLSNELSSVLFTLPPALTFGCFVIPRTPGTPLQQKPARYRT